MVNFGALEFAGGTVLHIASGMAALVAAIVLKKHKGIAAAYYYIIICFLVIIIDKGIGFRVNEEDEEMGLDTTQNGETGYNLV